MRDKDRISIDNEKEILDYIDKENPTTEQFVEQFQSTMPDAGYFVIRLVIEEKIVKRGDRYYLQ